MKCNWITDVYLFPLNGWCSCHCSIKGWAQAQWRLRWNMDKKNERTLNFSINFASRCFYYYFLSIKTLEYLTMNYTNHIEKGKVIKTKLEWLPIPIICNYMGWKLIKLDEVNCFLQFCLYKSLECEKESYMEYFEKVDNSKAKNHLYQSH